MGFGEVDLGGEGDAGEASFESEAMPEAPRTLAADGKGASMPAPAPGEAAIPQGQARTRDRGPAKKPSVAPRVALGLFVVAVLGGGGLELTPYGAFGRHKASDVMNAGTSSPNPTTDAMRCGITKVPWAGMNGLPTACST